MVRRLVICGVKSVNTLYMRSPVVEFFSAPIVAIILTPFIVWIILVFVR